MNKKLIYGSLLAAATLTLTACGGGSDDDDKDTTVNKFTETATWSAALPASGLAVCYDFDAKAEVADCTGPDWDLKLVSSGRTGSLYTNSGGSGGGNGAALGGPFDYTWTDLKKIKQVDLNDDDWEQDDELENPFVGDNTIESAMFEYGYMDLGLTSPPVHAVFPNYRTYLITTDNSKTYANGVAGQDGAKVFALQFTNFSSPAFRFADRTIAANTDNDTGNDVVQNSPAWSSTTDWVYYDLANNQKVATPSGNNWHIALKKVGQNLQVKTNSGVSGTGGKVGVYLAKTPSGFYNEGAAVAAKFQEAKAAVDAETPTPAQEELLASLLGDLTLDDTLVASSGGLAKPASANAWVKDSAESELNPEYTGTYPNPLNYGWLTYYPTVAAAEAAGLKQHQIKANPENGTLLLSGEGNSVARFHLKEVIYADPNDANSQQTWTFEFEIQPSAE